jgi:hypothetical protein
VPAACQQLRPRSQFNTRTLAPQQGRLWPHACAPADAPSTPNGKPRAWHSPPPANGAVAQRRDGNVALPRYIDGNSANPPSWLVDSGISN